MARLTATVSTAADGLSNVIDLRGYDLRAVEMSTGWTAADMTFMGAVNSTGTMSSVRVSTAGTELTYVTTAGYVLSVNHDHFAGVRYVQLRSGTTAIPVAQAVARTVYLGVSGKGDVD